jgi:hypothetical protein
MYACAFCKSCYLFTQHNSKEFGGSWRWKGGSYPGVLSRWPETSLKFEPFLNLICCHFDVHVLSAFSLLRSLILSSSNTCNSNSGLLCYRSKLPVLATKILCPSISNTEVLKRCFPKRLPATNARKRSPGRKPTLAFYACKQCAPTRPHAVKPFD